jgi:integrase
VPRRPGNDFVFGGMAGGYTSWTYATEKLRARVTEPVEFRLHDLRRSSVTHMAEQLKVQPHIIEALLGHVAGTQVSRTYNRAEYLAEKTAALAQWADFVMALVENRERKIMPLRA